MIASTHAARDPDERHPRRHEPRSVPRARAHGHDAITAILGALLPTLQERFEVGPTTLALIVAVFWISSSVTQPLLGSLAEDIGLRTVAALGVLAVTISAASSEAWAF